MNKLCLPFAPFMGVNHHQQSILFGCALLEDENEETFVWLFTEWLNCMHSQPPVLIITDQDIAMGNAIKRVFPTARHRYCSWHIDKHVSRTTFRRDITEPAVKTHLLALCLAPRVDVLGYQGISRRYGHDVESC